jgi:hypothetical protein
MGAALNLRDTLRDRALRRYASKRDKETAELVTALVAGAPVVVDVYVLKSALHELYGQTDPEAFTAADGNALIARARRYVVLESGEYEPVL